MSNEPRIINRDQDLKSNQGSFSTRLWKWPCIFCVILLLFPSSRIFGEGTKDIRATFPNRKITLPEKLDKLNILAHTPIPGVQQIGYLVAIEEGFYQREGLPPVECVWLSPGKYGVKELMSGRVQFSTIWMPKAYRLAAAGIDLSVIALVNHQSSLGIMLRKDHFQQINQIDDLSHRKVGVPLRTSENALMVLNHFKVSCVPVEHYNDGMSLLYRGIIDALFFTTYEGGVIQRYTTGQNTWRNFMMEDLHFSLPEEVIVCTGPFLHRYPEVCQKFVKATFDGFQYAMDKPEKALDILEKYYHQKKIFFDRIIVREQLAQWNHALQWTSRSDHNGDCSKDDFNRMRAHLISSKLLEENEGPPFEHFFYSIMSPEALKRLKTEK